MQKQQAQNAANISALQAQASSGAFGKGGLGAGAGAGTTVTPGATTTTTALGQVISYISPLGCGRRVPRPGALA